MNHHTFSRYQYFDILILSIGSQSLLDALFCLVRYWNLLSFPFGFSCMCLKTCYQSHCSHFSDDSTQNIIGGQILGDIMELNLELIFSLALWH